MTKNDTPTRTLQREGITSLDHALYCASCYAPHGPERTVTIVMAIDGKEELYRIEDGVPDWYEKRDEETGLWYKRVYTITVPPRSALEEPTR